MGIRRELMAPFDKALREFEEAVHKHGKKKFWESEVVLRQNMNRTRERLVEVVAKLVAGAQTEKPS